MAPSKQLCNYCSLPFQGRQSKTRCRGICNEYYHSKCIVDKLGVTTKLNKSQIDNYYCDYCLPGNNGPICKLCSDLVTGKNGVSCKGSCKYYFHFKCIKSIEKNDNITVNKISFICQQCKNDSLIKYKNSNSNPKSSDSIPIVQRSADNCTTATQTDQFLTNNFCDFAFDEIHSELLYKHKFFADFELRLKNIELNTQIIKEENSLLKDLLKKCLDNYKQCCNQSCLTSPPTEQSFLEIISTDESTPSDEQMEPSLFIDGQRSKVMPPKDNRHTYRNKEADCEYFCGFGKMSKTEKRKDNKLFKPLLNRSSNISPYSENFNQVNAVNKKKKISQNSFSLNREKNKAELNRYNRRKNSTESLSCINAISNKCNYNPINYNNVNKVKFNDYIVNDFNLNSKNGKIAVFISRHKINTNTNTIRDFLINKGIVKNDFTVKKLITKFNSYSSYHLLIDVEYYPLIFASNFWPCYLLIKHFKGHLYNNAIDYENSIPTGNADNDLQHKIKYEENTIVSYNLIDLSVYELDGVVGEKGPDVVIRNESENTGNNFSTGPDCFIRQNIPENEDLKVTKGNENETSDPSGASFGAFKNCQKNIDNIADMGKSEIAHESSYLESDINCNTDSINLSDYLETDCECSV